MNPLKKQIIEVVTQVANLLAALDELPTTEYSVLWKELRLLKEVSDLAEITAESFLTETLKQTEKKYSSLPGGAQNIPGN